jgi:SAM-dependent methyltransferase
MTAFSFRAFVERLRCPDCGAGFTFQPVPQPPGVRGEYGVLTCACFDYPVVSDVPILKKEPVTVNSISDDRVVLSGPRPEELTERIRAGEGLEGLLDLIAFSVCPWPLNRVPAGRALSQTEPLRAVGIAARKRALRRRLLAGYDDLTAEDWFDLFYWQSPAVFDDPFSYFFYRFGQPRHLAALALLTALPAADKPAMDLACGYGHLLHYLTTREEPLQAIGFDQNFHQVWVARHWVAPGAYFVCGDAERPLPFKDAALSAALCTDAFHHIRRKRGSLDELRRCTAGGTLVFAGVGNRLVEPLEGEECTPEAYAALLEPWPHRLRSEPELVAGYLRGEGPDLARPGLADPTAYGKWLYFVATQDASVLRKHPPFGAWPHAAGRLALNPLYRQRLKRGATELAFRFPSPWYAFENARMADYHPQTATLRDDALAEVEGNRRTARVDDLVARFVVLGLPAHYARPTGRPWNVAANRALTFFARNLLRRYRDAISGYRTAEAGAV